jgi:hypothetical protein
MPNLNSLQLVFTDVPMQPNYTNDFRRLIDENRNWQEDLLQNHTAERGEIQRYPRVQFRSLQGSAALFGVSGSPEIEIIVDENALPDARMNESDYELIDGKWIFTGNLKNGVILQATCLKKDMRNPKQKEFRVHVEGSYQVVKCSYSDDSLIGNDCLVITKNVPKKSSNVVAIEVIKPL